jgi:colicin import membrane protein
VNPRRPRPQGRAVPAEYCGGRGHTKVTAWRERRRLAAVAAGTAASPADTPVTMAKVTGAELLRLLRAEADRVAGIAGQLREVVDTMTDPTAAEAEAVRAAAEQRAARRVAAADADRDQALARAGQAEQAGQLAQQDPARALAAGDAARAETGRVRADVEKMLAGFRADAARDRDEVRADLRARAERAETQADAYRDELTQLRSQASPHTGTAASGTPPRIKP